MNKKPLMIPDFLRDAYNLSVEREALCKKQPECPECGTHQVQILCVSEQEWKCRKCKHVFFTEFEI